MASSRPTLRRIIYSMDACMDMSTRASECCVDGGECSSMLVQPRVRVTPGCCVRAGVHARDCLSRKGDSSQRWAAITLGWVTPVRPVGARIPRHACGTHNLGQGNPCRTRWDCICVCESSLCCRCARAQVNTGISLQFILYTCICACVHLYKYI